MLMLMVYDDDNYHFLPVTLRMEIHFDVHALKINQEFIKCDRIKEKRPNRQFGQN